MTPYHTARFALLSLTLLVTGFPCAVGAQDFTYLYSVMGSVGAVLALLVPLLVAIALALFIWGLVVYIAKSGDEKATEEGRRKMIWGIIALFIIVSVWGAVALIQEITGVYDVEGIQAPQALF